MRMMMKVSIPVAKGNQTLADGTLPRVLQESLGKLKPEAAYFTTLDGKRTALIFFDMTDPSQIPSTAEPFFNAFDASVEFSPVMNQEDLTKALGAMAQAAPGSR